MATKKKANPVGRPPFFRSAKEIETKVDEYFESLIVKEKDEDTGEMVESYTKPPTITGLALFLGFVSRQSFYEYKEKPEFTYTIKRARLRVEQVYEQHLFSKTPAGAIFALKNLGWSDKQEIDHTSGGEKIQPPPIVFTDFSKTT